MSSFCEKFINREQDYKGLFINFGSGGLEENLRGGGGNENYNKEGGASKILLPDKLGPQKKYLLLNGLKSSFILSDYAYQNSKSFV